MSLTSSTTSAAAPADSSARNAGPPKPHSQFRPATEGAPPADNLLASRMVTKSFRKGKIEVPVLKGVDFAVKPAEFVSIVGSSGSGKSTLLHLLGTLDSPDSGSIHFEGNRIDNLAPAGRETLRNKHFGMIFQFYYLLPELTALENVLVPAMIAHGGWGYWRRRAEYQLRATELMKQMGLSHRLTHRPRELSGGEMQRTAIARALISNPQVLFADEPTGNLDATAGKEILKLLRTLNEQSGLTIVMVTHDQALAAETDRVVRLVEGHIELG